MTLRRIGSVVLLLLLLILISPAFVRTMIRVELPFHLSTLASAGAELQLDIPAPVTLRSVLDAVESEYPMLRGTIRDHSTLKRRDFLRFFACNKDLSNVPMDTPLPPEVAAGTEPLLIVGAIAGG